MYTPTRITGSEDIDWSAALAGDPLDRYAAVSEVLTTWAPDVADVLHPYAVHRSDGATPDRAALAGDWTDGGHSDDAATDAVHDTARWALRQPADRVAVIPMRALVATAAHTVAHTSGEARAVLDAVQSGDVQSGADGGGRVVASRLAATTNIGWDLTPNRAARAARSALNTACGAIAAHVLAEMDQLAGGQDVRRVTVPTVRPGRTVRPMVSTLSLAWHPWRQCERDADGSPVADGAVWHGVSAVRRVTRTPMVGPLQRLDVARVTGGTVRAHGVVMPAELHGISMTATRAQRRVMRHAARVAETGRVAGSGGYWHPGRVAAVPVDVNGYPATLGYAPVTITRGAPVPMRALVGTMARPVVLAGLQRVHVVLTAHPALTRAAWQQDTAAHADTPAPSDAQRPSVGRVSWAAEWETDTGGRYLDDTARAGRKVCHAAAPKVARPAEATVTVEGAALTALRAMAGQRRAG